MTILAEIYDDPTFFGSGPGFVSGTQFDPGFVNPVRSGPGFVNPIRSDPVQILGFVNTLVLKKLKYWPINFALCRSTSLAINSVL